MRLPSKWPSECGLWTIVKSCTNISRASRYPARPIRSSLARTRSSPLTMFCRPRWARASCMRVVEWKIWSKVFSKATTPPCLPTDRQWVVLQLNLDGTCGLNGWMVWFLGIWKNVHHQRKQDEHRRGWNHSTSRAHHVSDHQQPEQRHLISHTYSRNVASIHSACCSSQRVHCQSELSWNLQRGAQGFAGSCWKRASNKRRRIRKHE